MAYSDTILADSPVAYWRLQETSGTNADDATANNNDGTFTPNAAGAWTGGTVGIAGGIAGAGAKAALFNGTTGYVEFVYATDPTEYTLEAWVQIPVVPTANQIIVCRGSSSAGYFILRLKSTGVFEFMPNGSSLITGTTVAVPGVWYHVVGTAKNSTNAHLYVNGTEEGTPIATGTLSTTPDRYRVGGLGSATYFSGYITEAAVYATQLTAELVAAHYAARGTVDASANARATQVLAEVLKSGPCITRVTQVYGEVMENFPTVTYASMVYAEVVVQVLHGCPAARRMLELSEHGASQ